MTSLLHFKDKVHSRNLTQVKSIPLLFPRLLCQVLEHIGFPTEPQLERHRDCEAILTIEKWQHLPSVQHLPPQDLAEDQPPLAVHIEEPQIAPSIALAVTAPLPTSPTSSAPPVPLTSTHSAGTNISEPPLQHVSISLGIFSPLWMQSAPCQPRPHLLRLPIKP